MCTSSTALEHNIIWQSQRTSLGSSAALAFDEGTDTWSVFYFSFISCNDTAFVNRQGRTFRAVAKAWPRRSA